jgi:osmotically-inducible protein OsmY
VRLAALTFIPHEVKEMKIRIMGALTWAVAGLAFTIPTGTPVAAHAQDQANPPSSTAPDNSGQNKEHNRTAENQKETTSDREITQKIRRSVVSEKSLSTYAHNVKIITQGGQVTLKGPVRSENEKETIASKAADVVGAEKVNNQLTVKQ